MNSKSILLVEDDRVIASGLVYALEQEGYAVTHCKNVSEARSFISSGHYDIAILDLQLPDGTGFDVRELLKMRNAAECSKLPAGASPTAVIFLTVVDDEGNIIRAFNEGADDYITKPFRLRELLARVKRALNAYNNTITLGNVTIDTSAGKSYINNTLLELTALEYRLLLIFASNKGQILSRTQILEHIWDAAGNFVEDNTLTVYIKRLREKLGNAVSIKTIRGLGYRVD